MINNYQLLEKQERLAVGAFLLSFGLMGLNTPDMFECEPIKNGVLHYKRIKTRGRRDDEAEMFVKVPEEITPLIKEYSDKTKRRAFKFYLHYKNYKSMQGADIYAKKDWSIYWDANDKVIKTLDWSPLTKREKN